MSLAVMVAGDGSPIQVTIGLALAWSLVVTGAFLSAAALSRVVGATPSLRRTLRTLLVGVLVAASGAGVGALESHRRVAARADREAAAGVAAFARSLTARFEAGAQRWEQELTRALDAKDADTLHVAADLVGRIKEELRQFDALHPQPAALAVLWQHAAQVEGTLALRLSVHDELQRLWAAVRTADWLVEMGDAERALARYAEVTAAQPALLQALAAAFGHVAALPPSLEVSGLMLAAEQGAARGRQQLRRAKRRRADHEAGTPHARAWTAPSCCRHCSVGKPCGDGCIAAHRTCRKPPGCAC
jgi:hypothetical protein